MKMFSACCELGVIKTDFFSFLFKESKAVSVFFWVFPRRLIMVCRRFGTLYLFHLQSL